LTQSEIAELFGTDLLGKALDSYILLFPEGISLADIAPDTDGALPDHVGHDERGAGMSDSLDVMRWGLVPFWAKDIKVGFSNINAKAEGIEGKPAFREALPRCRRPGAAPPPPVLARSRVARSDFGQFLPVLILELAGRRSCTI
jgi:putative SOS response-associated peptidase YedK